MSAIFAEMLQHTGILLPVLAVKLVYAELGLLREVEAIDVDTVAIGIGTGHIKRLDAASRTKQVPCNTGVKAVFSQEALPGKETKITGWNNQVNVATHLADRTITFIGKQFPARHDFILNRATMTASPDGYFAIVHIVLSLIYPIPPGTILV
jgi:hypothetical protein